MFSTALLLVVASADPSPATWRRGLVPLGLHVSAGAGPSVGTSDTSAVRLAQTARLELDVAARWSIGLEGVLVRGFEANVPSFGIGSVALLARVAAVSETHYRMGFGLGLEAGLYSASAPLLGVPPCSDPFRSCGPDLSYFRAGPTADVFGEWWPWRALGLRLAVRYTFTPDLADGAHLHRVTPTLQLAFRI